MPENETSYFPITTGYFNLDPRAFGPNFDIFELGTVTEYTISNSTLSALTTGDWSSQTSLSQYAISTSTGTSSSKVDSAMSAICCPSCNNYFQ